MNKEYMNVFYNMLAFSILAKAKRLGFKDVVQPSLIFLFLTNTSIIVHPEKIQGEVKKEKVSDAR